MASVVDLLRHLNSVRRAAEPFLRRYGRKALYERRRARRGLLKCAFNSRFDLSYSTGLGQAVKAAFVFYFHGEVKIAIARQENHLHVAVQVPQLMHKLHSV
jgi:hypothetical protein